MFSEISLYGIEGYLQILSPGSTQFRNKCSEGSGGCGGDVCVCGVIVTWNMEPPLLWYGEREGERRECLLTTQLLTSTEITGSEG